VYEFLSTHTFEIFLSLSINDKNLSKEKILIHIYKIILKNLESKMPINEQMADDCVNVIIF